ncbi:hypothetical protein [Salegentibacter sp. Hel_I_6]|uniref:hypothetical protein n=1 Tax=Salegentibacter sp. Hel_I_6 TaxID=1250278 RepID=UPI0005639016|nr:hypothetical protein [Salegentibacter sp. Hel_I_6]
MQNDIFYIVIKNRFYYHNCNCYHIEKIFSKKDVLGIVENIIKQMANDDFEDKYHPFIVTNDNEFLLQYIFALNLSDFKILCGSKEFDENEIRINHRNFKKFDEEVLYYFSKIKNGEIISANQCWSFSTLERVDFGNGDFEYWENTGKGEFIQEYEGWQMNKEFEYFKTPLPYQKEDNKNKVFNFKNLETASIEELNELLNVNILELTFFEKEKKHWIPVGNQCLKYFDRESKRNLYLSQSILERLKTEQTLKLAIETTLDKEFFITHLITGLIDENSDQVYLRINYENAGIGFQKKYIEPFSDITPPY